MNLLGALVGFPMDVGQRTASLFQEEIDNGGVVRKQAELFAQGSCGVADVDARQSRCPTEPGDIPPRRGSECRAFYDKLRYSLLFGNLP